MGPWQEFFQPVLPALINALAPLMPAVGQMLLAKKGHPPSGVPSAPVPSPAAAPPAATRPQQPTAQGQGQEFAEMAAAIVPFVFNAIAQPGTNGGDLAYSLMTLFGPLRYQQVAALGKEALLTILQSHPLWQQLGPLQERVPQFVQEFIDYAESENVDDSGDQEPEDGETALAEESAPVPGGRR